MLPLSAGLYSAPSFQLNIVSEARALNGTVASAGRPAHSAGGRRPLHSSVASKSVSYRSTRTPPLTCQRSPNLIVSKAYAATVSVLPRLDAPVLPHSRPSTFGSGSY